MIVILCAIVFLWIYIKKIEELNELKSFEEMINSISSSGFEKINLLTIQEEAKAIYYKYPNYEFYKFYLYICGYNEVNYFIFIDKDHLLKFVIKYRDLENPGELSDP